MTKLLVIGFDAMDYFMAKNTIKASSFKIFAPILKRQVVKEAVTGPSWASFYTGLDKDIHGVTDEWGRDTGGSNSFQEIQVHAFWNIVSEAGYRVYVDNLPITADGFPFTSSKEKDIVNWIYNPLEGGAGHWRSAIREMDFEVVLCKIRSDSFSFVNAEKLRGRDLIFIQFSFLDRVGHTFTFKNTEVMKKSYALAYELIDKLVEITQPQYLIVTSDHGFCKNSTHHLFANSATLILNTESYNFFTKNQVFRLFSASNSLNWKKIKILLSEPWSAQILLEALRYIFHFNYVRQTDVFDVILEMFDVDYEKPTQRIQKVIGKGRNGNNETMFIEERLRRLGYL